MKDYGGVAQLGERLVRNEKVAGSNPVTSIYFSPLMMSFLGIEEFKPLEIYHDFPQPLLEGIFLKRLNRFTGLLKFKDKIIRVHIPNSGRLEEALKEGLTGYFHPAKGIKTEGVLQLIDNKGKFISIDSRIPNKLIGELLERRLKKERFELKREVKIDSRRIDFLVEGKGRVWIETKSITLVKDGFALFPDSPTLRGREHVKELIKIKKNGDDGIIIFVVQREDAEKFTPNRKVDPEFSALVKEAISEGVEVLAFNCSVSRNRIYLNRKIEVSL